MKDWNTCFAYLNMELPDDIRRLKEAGYYNAAIARIDACLAEDWTASQNQPLHPQGALPVNPTPHGVDAWRQGLLAHREILRRLPQDYTLTAEQLLNRLQATLRDFTTEEFAALDAAGQMDWRFVEGQKRYIYRAAETLVATHPDLAARQLDPPVPERSWDRFEPQHDQMVRTGAVSADITLRTSIGMTVKSSTELENADYILLEGGVNDAWNNAKLGALNGSFDPAFYMGDTIGTLEAMLDYLAKKRSDKRVAYVFPHGGLFASSENWYKTYKPAILAALKKWGVPYVDIEECAPPMGAHGVSELSDKYTIDGTHPNKAGYERFYMEPIAALLKRL